MSAKVDKYVDLLSMFALYGNNGYYIDPIILTTMILDELKLPMTLVGIKKFVEDADITVTEEEIKEFLDKTMDEEEPTLREALSKPYKPLPKNLVEATEEDIARKSEHFQLELLKRRYEFEPYSLQYFKTYISILKEKCKTLFDIYNDLFKNIHCNITEEGWNRFLDLDFHINYKGNIYMLDAERLVDAIVYNVRDLYDKVQQGNNPSTYLTFKCSFESLFEEELTNIYPSKEVQSKDYRSGHLSQFIALSDGQVEKLKQQELDGFRRQMKEDIDEGFNGTTTLENPHIVKSMKK